MLLEKIRWAFKLLRSTSFVVMTDKESVISIPVSMGAFDNVFLLTGQTASLLEFKERLDALIEEHKAALKEVDTRAEAQERSNWETNIKAKRASKRSKRDKS